MMYILKHDEFPSQTVKLEVKSSLTLLSITVKFQVTTKYDQFKFRFTRIFVAMPSKSQHLGPLGDLGVDQQLMLLPQELSQRQGAAPDQTTWEHPIRKEKRCQLESGAIL